MKFWFDTEFIEDGKTIDLISIGIVAEDGRTFYAESLECEYDRALDEAKEACCYYAGAIPNQTGEVDRT